MIWITTLLLIAVAIWLYLEGRNERRWVQDHLDDEAVAADKGLLPKYEDLKQAPEPTERYSVAQAENRVGKFAAKAKEKTRSLGDAVERRATPGAGDSAMAAKRQKRSEKGNSITGPDSFIGRTADKLAAKTDKVVDKIPEGRLVSDSHYGDQPPGRVRSLINSVTDRLDKIDEQVKQP